MCVKCAKGVLFRHIVSKRNKMYIHLILPCIKCFMKQFDMTVVFAHTDIFVFARDASVTYLITCSNRNCRVTSLSVLQMKLATLKKHT